MKRSTYSILAFEKQKEADKKNVYQYISSIKNIHFSAIDKQYRPIGSCGLSTLSTEGTFLNSKRRV